MSVWVFIKNYFDTLPGHLYSCINMYFLYLFFHYIFWAIQNLSKNKRYNTILHASALFQIKWIQIQVFCRRHSITIVKSNLAPSLVFASEPRSAVCYPLCCVSSYPLISLPQWTVLLQTCSILDRKYRTKSRVSSAEWSLSFQD